MICFSLHDGSTRNCMAIAVIVPGEVTLRKDEKTGARADSLIRGVQPAPTTN